MSTQEQIRAVNAGGPVVQVLIPGFQGPTGISAYQAAVSLGFSGTVAEWLLTLQGEQGPTGPKGDDGANFTLLEVDEFSQPIFPSPSVGGQGGYAADIDTFYVCTEGGSPGTWEAATDVAGSVFNVYNPLIDAAGSLADRDAFDAEPVGFPFLDIDAQVVYVREGAPGNWGPGIPFRGQAGNTVRSSDGPPSFLDGVDGDYNIDYTNWDIYGPKTAGSWGAARSLDFPAEVAQQAAEDAQDAADAAQLAADNAQLAADNAQDAADNAQSTADAAVIAAADAAPVSAVAFVARNTAPTGWLKANGALVSRTTYAALFSAIGTTFGAGDGSTTFALPDLRGEFIRSWDDGRGVDASRAFGSFQADQLQNITGTLGNVWGTGSPVAGALSSAVGGSSNQPGTGGNTSRDVSFSASGSPGARTGTETRPRNIALLAVIKF